MSVDILVNIKVRCITSKIFDIERNQQARKSGLIRHISQCHWMCIWGVETMMENFTKHVDISIQITGADCNGINLCFFFIYIYIYIYIYIMMPTWYYNSLFFDNDAGISVQIINFFGPLQSKILLGIIFMTWTYRHKMLVLVLFCRYIFQTILY